MVPNLAIRYLPSGAVKVNILGTIGVFSFRAWLNRTDAAIAVRQAAQGAKPVTPKEKAAALWLHAAGLNKQEKIDQYLQRRSLFDSPEDASRIIHCHKCGRVLSDPLSKALGYGPDCRKN